MTSPRDASRAARARRLLRELLAMRRGERRRGWVKASNAVVTLGAGLFRVCDGRNELTCTEGELDAAVTWLVVRLLGEEVEPDLPLAIRRPDGYRWTQAALDMERERGAAVALERLVTRGE